MVIMSQKVTPRQHSGVKPGCYLEKLFFWCEFPDLDLQIKRVVTWVLPWCFLGASFYCCYIGYQGNTQVTPSLSINTESETHTKMATFLVNTPMVLPGGYLL